MAKIDNEIERTEAKTNTKLNPPGLLVWLVVLLLPRDDQHGPRFLLDDLWSKTPSIREVLPELSLNILKMIYVRIRSGLCGMMLIAQGCTLFILFAGVMSWPVLFILGLTFLALLLHVAYMPLNERLEREFVTAFMAPILIVVFDVGFGMWNWARGFPAPYFPMMPDVLIPRVLALAIPIAWVRHRYAPASGPQNPYKADLALYYRTWLFNDLWITCALTFLLSLEVAAPAKWFFQGFLTVNPAVLLFTTALRFQLNPIAGISRHRRIFVTLLTDPFENEIREMRDYLLAGADWFANFTAQSLCEILSFFF